jgi:hypothetical protein
MLIGAKYSYDLLPTFLSLYCAHHNGMSDIHLLLLLLLLLSSFCYYCYSLSPLCWVFTIINLKHAMLLGYRVLQVFFSYNLWHISCYFRCWMFRTSSSVLSKVCVQCTTWRLSLVSVKLLRYFLNDFEMIIVVRWYNFGSIIIIIIIIITVIIIILYVYAGYIQLYTWNKPCF